MKKIIVSLIALALMSASCNFGQPTAKVGMLKTANGGVDWQPANKIVNNTKTLLEKSISQLKFGSTTSNKLFASSFDGGLYSSEDAGENWTEVLGGVNIYDFAINPNDDKNIYAASYLGDRGRVIETKDGGKTWNEVYSDAGSKNPVRAVTLNPNNPSEVMIGMGLGSLIESSDSGASWRLINNYNDRINRINWLADGTVYVVVKKTGVFKSTDNGSSFQQISKTLVPAPDVSKYDLFGSPINDYRQLAIDPSNQSSLWLTTNKGLFHSTNSGTTWNYVSMPFRDQDASPFAVAVAPTSSSVLYVTSNQIIFKSIDGGTNWSSSNTNTNGLVFSLLISQTLPQVAFAGVSQ